MTVFQRSAWAEEEADSVVRHFSRTVVMKMQISLTMLGCAYGHTLGEGLLDGDVWAQGEVGW